MGEKIGERQELPLSWSCLGAWRNPCPGPVRERGGTPVIAPVRGGGSPVLGPVW